MTAEEFEGRHCGRHTESPSAAGLDVDAGKKGATKVLVSEGALTHVLTGQ